MCLGGKQMSKKTKISLAGKVLAGGAAKLAPGGDRRVAMDAGRVFTTRADRDFGTLKTRSLLPRAKP